MNILIVEDEIPATKRLVKLLTELEPTWEIVHISDEVDTTVKWLNKHEPPDLIFMDIQLADGYSFSIFEQTKVTSPVIFVTAFDQYAVDAFRVNGLDYILKPIQSELLAESIDRFKRLNTPKAINFNAITELLAQKEKHFKERFLIKSGTELSFVRTSEIAYFLSESSYSFVITKSGNRYILDQTLDRIEDELDPSFFFRINRKQLVSLDSIEKISTYFNNRLILDLKPAEPEETIVSRTRVKQFKEWLNQ